MATGCTLLSMGKLIAVIPGECIGWLSECDGNDDTTRGQRKYAKKYCRLYFIVTNKEGLNSSAIGVITAEFVGNVF